MLVLLLGAMAGEAGAAGSPSRTSTSVPVTAPKVPLLPKAWILVDVDTARVLDEHDAHTRRRPASTIKLLTALTARRHIDPDRDVAVSDLAAGMPARKIGLTAGVAWPFADVLASAMVVSANDAAVALAEASGGTLDGFATQMQQTMADLGAVDGPVVDDPAGLDDSFAHGQGDWISAWDLALVGQAALRDPEISDLASSQTVRFTDVEGHAHKLTNHNKLLTRYEGANGLKTGYTEAAGNTLVASATRGGRTMLVVVLDAPDLYGPVEALFDRGFATAPNGELGPMLVARPLPAVRSVALAKPRTAGSGVVSRDTGEWAALAAAGSAIVYVETRRRRRPARR